MAELLGQPAVKFVRVGKDAGAGRPVETVDGQAELVFPAPAGSNRVLKVVGNRLPGLENLSLLHAGPSTRNAGYFPSKIP